jgi:glycosyltransferase involved in cell wall biosynthesis
VTIVALLPAHNEAEHIVGAIAGLRAQTRLVDRIIVVADNCTDATESLARDAGAEVAAHPLAPAATSASRRTT